MAMYNADEVFEIAQQIERNGAAFYLEASKIIDESDAKALLTNLSQWESEHERAFAQLRAKLADLNQAGPGQLDPENLQGQYLRAIADSYIFNVEEEPADLLAGNPPLQDILEMALDREKNSIVFYLGIKLDLPDPIDCERIDKIIKEEMHHVVFIRRELDKLL